MNTTYFKQMPITSDEFNEERVEIFSYDRIANIVLDTIINQLVNEHGWEHEAAVEFAKSKALRYGLDGTLGDLLEMSAARWVARQEQYHKAECHAWVKESVSC